MLDVAASYPGPYRLTPAQWRLCAGKAAPAEQAEAVLALVRVREGVDVPVGALGQQDDALALQQALDAAAPHGGRVALPAGVFTYGATLVVPPLVSLGGAGRDATTLRYTGTTGPAISLQGTPAANRAKVTVENLGLHGPETGAAFDGIDGAYLVQSALRNVRVRKFRNGINLAHSWCNTLERVVCDENSQDGLNLGLDANNLLLQACELQANGRAGLYARGPRAVKTVGCNAEGNAVGVYLAAETGFPVAAVSLDGWYLEGNTQQDVLILSLDGVERPTSIVVRDSYLLALRAGTQAIRAREVDGLTLDGLVFDRVGGRRHDHSLYLPDGGAASVVWGHNQDKSRFGRHVGSGMSLTER